MTPKINKYISGILLIGALALVGAGCTTPPEENTNSETTTSAVEETAIETAAVETEETAEQEVTVEEGQETESVDENNSGEEANTSDWLTYKDEEFGFSFQYPSDWVAKSIRAGDDFFVEGYDKTHIQTPNQINQDDFGGAPAAIRITSQNESFVLDSENQNDQSTHLKSMEELYECMETRFDCNDVRIAKVIVEHEGYSVMYQHWYHLIEGQGHTYTLKFGNSQFTATLLIDANSLGGDSEEIRLERAVDILETVKIEGSKIDIDY